MAVATRPDAIVATGRSDYPNQVNNVLGFPFIFRGALDVRATTVNDEMKLAATRALAALAREDVPDSVRRAYGVERLEFGRQYIIPKPFDPRVLIWEAAAVAQAAMETGVAQEPIDLDEYREQLERRLGKAHEVMRIMIHKAQQPAQARGLPGRRRAQDPARLPDPDGREDRPAHPARQTKPRIRAAHGRIASAPGRPAASSIRPSPRACRATPKNCTACASARASRAREAGELILNRNYFGSMMVRLGDADALVGGLTQHYPDTIRPALQVIAVRARHAPGFAASM